jgi:succinyl-diaminopimelate desuccinylase
LTLLHELRDGFDAGGAGELAQLAELLLGIDAPREHREHESSLRLGTGRRVWLANLHEPDHATGYPPAMTLLSDRLAARTLELVDIPSESRHEAAIRDYVLSLVPQGFEPEFAGDDAFLLARERRAGVPLVVLAGHYDTVPAQDNLPGRIADGAVHGLGAADMKGGVAVALELVRDLAEEPVGAVDVALLVFGREELPSRFNPLPALFEGSRLVHDASLAILLEPTAGAIQAGCVGNMTARVTFRGVSGHSARPWLAQNAIYAAIEGLARVAGSAPREVVISGLPFFEVASVTRLEAGIADNVVPDRATATINYRYTPDRTSEEAQAHLRSLLPVDVDVEIDSDSPPARVVADATLVRALRDAGDLALEPKQAWTNVADFTSRGIDAVNFGPGDPVFAHRRDERVDIAALVHCYETLRRFLAG